MHVYQIGKSIYTKNNFTIFGRNLKLPTIVQHIDIADTFSFQKHRIQMILPNVTSFDTLDPRKAFTIIIKDGVRFKVRLDMILTQMVQGSFRPKIKSKQNQMSQHNPSLNSNQIIILMTLDHCRMLLLRCYTFCIPLGRVS